MVVTAHESPPTTPTDASQSACMPPGHDDVVQQCAKTGVPPAAEVLPALETALGALCRHQPGRAETRLPPGQVAPSGHTRHVLSHP